MFAILAISLLAASAAPSGSPPGHGDFGFVRNEGQWDTRAQFRASVPGLDLWVTHDGVTLDYNTLTDRGRKGHVVRVQFEGTQVGKAVGNQPLPTRMNYLVGDSSRWATNVGVFEEAWVQNVGDGIDARYYFSQGRPRYDVVVRPGTDPQSVRMGYEGAHNVRVGRDGLLRYDTSLGTVTEKGLFAYQKSGQQVVQVAAAPLVNNDGTVSFRIGSYDRSKPLIIDPYISFTTIVGNLGVGSYGGSAQGLNGSTVIVGTTSDPTFPTSPGAYDSIFNGTSGVTLNGVVTRVNADGTIAWRTLLGSDLELNAVAVDADDQPVIVGTAASASSIVGATGYRGQHDGFIVRLNATGTGMSFGRFVGGNRDDSFKGVAVTPTRIVAVGYGAINFPVTNGAYDTKTRGNSPDGVVYVLDAATITPVWATYFGQNGTTNVNSVAVAPNGNIVIAGDTSNATFPVTAGASDTTYGGASEGFLAELSSNGTTNNWCTFVGGSGDERLPSLDTTSDGAILVGGYTTSTNIPGLANSNGGLTDGMVLRYSSSGALVGGRYIGGSGNESVQSVAIDDAGNLAVVGTASSTGTFITSNAAFQTLSGGEDSFFARLSASANDVLYGTLLGIPGIDGAYGLTMSGDDVVISGMVGTEMYVYGLNAAPSYVFGLSANSVVGTPGTLGQVTGTITLDAPAPTNLVFDLSSACTAATVPATVTVLAGASSATFTVNTVEVYSATSGLITSAYESATSSQSLTVAPVEATLSLASSSMIGQPNRKMTATLSLSQVVGHDVTATLTTSSDKDATVPASVTVPAGESNVQFDVTSHRAVHTSRDVTFEQTYGGVSGQAVLSILPPDIASVTVAPDSFKGGNTTLVTITFNTPVPSDGQNLPRKILWAAGQKAGQEVVVMGSYYGTNVAVPGAMTHSFRLFGRRTENDMVWKAVVGGVESNAFTVLRPRVGRVWTEPTQKRGPSSVIGYVVLDSPAPAQGLTVRLQNSLDTIVTLPQRTVTIAPFTRKASFPIEFLAVSEDRVSEIRARVENTDDWKIARFTVKAPRLLSAVVGQGGGWPGKVINFRLNITSQARIGGLKVNMEETGTSYLTLPIDSFRNRPCVTVPGGETEVVFKVTISPDAPVGSQIHGHYELNGQLLPFVVNVTAAP